ncbi:MAG: HEAT repeat domain-containing protein [Desulfobacterales bacterium]|nr:HEAT repeat domain-containing protein [Desulfobacterales bacterium]
METSKLLDAIIDATENKPIPVVRIVDNRALFSIAQIKNSSKEKKETLSLNDQFEENVLLSLFSKISSDFNKIRTLFRKEFPWHDIIKIEKRLYKKVRAIESLPFETQKKMFAILHSKNIADVSAAVFTLSSIKANSEKFFDILMPEFARTEPEYLQCFINGLKWSYSNKTSEKIHLVFNFVNEEVKEACLNILSFRDDHPLPDHTTKENRDNLKLSLMVKDPATKDMMALESKLDIPPVHVDLIYRLLMLGSEKVFEHIVKALTNSLENNAKLLVWLAMSCSKEQLYIIKDAFGSKNPNVRCEAYLAAGISGSTDFLNLLVSSLQVETDESCIDILNKALELLTGIKGDNTLSFWEKSIKKMSFRGTGLRKGKRLNLDLLINEIEDTNNSFFHREIALKELLIRSNLKINYHLDWPVERQLKVLNEIKTKGIKESLFDYNREKN